MLRRISLITVLVSLLIFGGMGSVSGWGGGSGMGGGSSWRWLWNGEEVRE